MPEIIKLENSLSPKQLLIDFEAKRPKIVSISIPNDSKNVDPNITEITLTFDRPMSIYNNGSSYGKKGKIISLYSIKKKQQSGIKKLKRNGLFMLI